MPTYANVRTKTVQNVSPGLSPSSTVRIAPVCQCSGFHTGSGLLKIGSTPPNATASTAYVGTRKRSASQAAPGSAKLGQNQRLVNRFPRFRLSGLEARPDVLPERLSVGRQREQRQAVVEVGLADDRAREVLRDV